MHSRETLISKASGQFEADGSGTVWAGYDSEKSVETGCAMDFDVRSLGQIEVGY